LLLTSDARDALHHAGHVHFAIHAALLHDGIVTGRGGPAELRV
jgi:hypothetical protein